ncbi:kinesin-like protein KIF3B [Varroa jacobsoni]|uniref:Kinesin-like protein n=1 Tax=Varroa destructor TaxID=109461 RepID=A0A7M7JLP0_VARDE|nr:kinesin-like protein KIF3B [Varroa destructor]XP_022687719.1 kinesin-like protein KIF3B [Varroa jacobsoni]
MSAKSGKSESVKVIVRCRLMSDKEKESHHRRVVTIHPERNSIELTKADEEPKQFTFDAVYDEHATQKQLYNETFSPLVDSVLEGFNGTIFAYGQTGTGKTYTMEGIRTDPERRGVIPNSFQHIFDHIRKSRNKQYLVRASYLEIYQEEIRDLIAKDQSTKLELKERPDTGVHVKDLSSFVCKSVQEIERVMTVGNQNRAVGRTNMNLHSSRSHAIFIITVEHSDIEEHTESAATIRVGKLNLVDLAGSERQSKTNAQGTMQKEAIKINLSLSALGNVISSLVDGKSTHVPYRDSKLTRLLEDSLGGNAKTIMIANIGPSHWNYEETLTTLRYASRAKNIKNKPKVNEDPKDALLREFQLEIARLKMQLEEKGKRKGKSKSAVSRSSINSDSSADGGGLMSPDVADVEYTEKLAAKVAALESKLLGGKDIIEHTNEQERALELKRKEIAEQKRIEREIVKKLELHEESASEIREGYTSLQQEVDAKTKKLRKLYGKLQAAKIDIKDLTEENNRERRELEATQHELTKELKLKYMIIENFIPVQEKAKILSRIVYDDETESWDLLPYSMVLNNELGTSAVHPLADSHNPKRLVHDMAHKRYKVADASQVSLGLEFVDLRVREYHPPKVSPTLQTLLDDVMKPLPDLEVDAGLPQYKLVHMPSSKSKGRRSPKSPSASSRSYYK